MILRNLFKFETVVPVAFRIASEGSMKSDRDVRIACRDSFRETTFIEKNYPHYRRNISRW